MKKIRLLLIFTVILFILSGCSDLNGGNTPDGNDANSEIEIADTLASYKEITPEDAKKLLEENKEAVLLDVRTEEEYKEGHIPGSVLIPYDVIKSEAEKVVSDKDATIIVYCRSGRRSEIASRALIEMGYKNVYDLGGIIDWPYEIESGS